MSDLPAPLPPALPPARPAAAYARASLAPAALRAYQAGWQALSERCALVPDLPRSVGFGSAATSPTDVSAAGSATRPASPRLRWTAPALRKASAEIGMLETGGRLRSAVEIRQKARERPQRYGCSSFAERWER